MDTIKWERVQEIFQAAIELPADQQSAYVEDACAGDLELYHEIISLLKEDTESHPLLDGYAIDAVGLPEELTNPSTALEEIGKYQVVRQLGAGGMGIVYLVTAKESDPPEQFALKLLKWWSASESSVKRFQREQKILSQLDHVNIARLIEVGFTPDELPYIVMEYVDGEPVDQYCDRLQLSISERLNLFREICAAVHFAHRKQVVHRDLKPENILVTADGTVKLLDFGISKMLKSSGKDSFVTLAGMRVMTPEYASPEQVRGKDITTISDVYTLGVVLYELLTGVRPLTVSGSSILDVEQVICHQRPDKPSETLLNRIESDKIERKVVDSICETRKVQFQELSDLLKGNLDDICLSSLEKEPTRRYPSVMFLAEDIRRALEGEAIFSRHYG